VRARCHALQAAAWGVYLHAKAAESLGKKLGVVGFLARELSSEIPALLAAFSPTRAYRKTSRNRRM
jgi:NAD(P)H-hydrate repair Nnr-like enzyme with NAD(P)H-hydrate dehydratase domain